MAEVNLKGQTMTVSDGNDGVVIVNCLAELQGGRSVTVPTSVTGDNIQAGHIVVKDDTSGNYELLALNSDGDAYDQDSETTGSGESEVTTYSMPEGKTAVGVIKYSVQKSKPLVAVMTQGQVNGTASPFPITDGIKAALPLIQFVSND